MAISTSKLCLIKSALSLPKFSGLRGSCFVSFEFGYNGRSQIIFVLQTLDMCKLFRGFFFLEKDSESDLQLFDVNPYLME